MGDESRWTEDVVSRLVARDVLEKKEADFYRAFSQLSELARVPGEPDNDLGEKVRENARLEAENRSLVESINNYVVQVEKLEVRTGMLSKKLELAEKARRVLQGKLENATMEIGEKNRTIEIINDELLLNQIQNNVLGDKVRKLTEENEELVKRWMEKMKQDAERLNEANEQVGGVGTADEPEGSS